MKTPRANFVVEYKTSRRQLKQRATSIWGDLDLQAVARQIKADNTGPDNVPNPAASTHPARRSGESPTSIVEVRSEFDQPSIVSTPVSMTGEKNQDDMDLDDPSFEDPSAVHAPPGDFARLANAGPEKRKGRGANQKSLREPKSSKLHLHDALVDELDLLEADNRQLKRLMLAKFREENEWMKSMLNRFVGT